MTSIPPRTLVDMDIPPRTLADNPPWTVVDIPPRILAEIPPRTFAEISGHSAAVNGLSAQSFDDFLFLGSFSNCLQRFMKL